MEYDIFTSASFWIFAIISALVLLWPEIFLRQYEVIRQEDLADISSAYEGLNRLYLLSSIISLLIIFPVIFLGIYLAMALGVDQPWIFYSLIMLAFPWVGLSRGFVAAKAGVYPASKFFHHKTLYVYSRNDGDRIRRIGRIQVFIAPVLTIIVFVAVFFG